MYRAQNDVYIYNIRLGSVWLTKLMQDATRSTAYKLQVWKYGILPESISLSGVGANGEMYTRCIPYGFLRVRPEIFLPLPMARLQVSLSYGPFVLAIPNETVNTANAAGFLTSFEGNMTKEACAARGSADTVAFTQYSGSGCYIVRQPAWDTCGRTRAKDTQDFLNGISGRVHGFACVNNGREECMEMNSTGSEVSISFTDDGISQVFGVYDLQLSLDIASSRFEILSKSTYAPEHGINVVKEVPVFTQLINVFPFINGGRLETRHERPKDIIGPLLPGSWNMRELSFNIYDGPGIMDAEFLDVAVVSSELDCRFDRTLWHRTGSNTTYTMHNMGIPSTPPDLCELRDYKMSEVCPNGWKPTTGFRIPMALLRAAFLGVRTDSGKDHIWLDLPATCKSFEHLPQISTYLGAHWTLHISSHYWLRFVIAAHGEKKTLTKEVQCQTSPCNVEMGDFVHWEAEFRGAEFFITALLEDNCSLTLEDELDDREICEAEGMARAEICGGPRPSTTISLPFQEVVLHDYKLWIDGTFRCPDRLLSPAPMQFFFLFI